MATRYVDPNANAGGNGTTTALTGANCAYNSLSACEAARQSDTGGTLTEIEEWICRTNGGAADTSAVVIDGWTVTSSFYIDIKADAAYQHSGVWDTTKYRLENTYRNLVIHEDFVRVTGLQFRHTGVNGVDPPNGSLIEIGAGISASSAYISRCLLKGAAGNGNKGIVVNTNSGQPQRIWNTLIYDCPGTGILNTFTQTLSYAYNVTIHNCGTGFNDGGNDWVAKNVLVQDCTTCFSTNFGTGSTNNASDDNTQPGANGRNGEVTFVNEAGDDFHLATGDTIAKGFGVSLTSDSGIAFSTDIDGATRGATWDIGADQTVGGETQELVSTVAAVSGASPLLTVTYAIASTLSPASSTSPPLTVTYALAASIAPASSTTGAVGLRMDLVSSIAPASAVTALLTAQWGMASTVNVVAATQAELSALWALATAINAVSAVLQTSLPVDRLLVGNVPAVSAVTDISLLRTMEMVGSIPVTAEIQALLHLSWALFGNVPGVSSLSNSELNIVGTVELDGVVAANANVLALLALDLPLAGTVPASTTVAALLTFVHLLQAQVTAASATSADVARQVGLQAVLSALSDLQVSLSRTMELVGNIAIDSDTVANLTGVAPPPIPVYGGTVRVIDVFGGLARKVEN